MTVFYIDCILTRTVRTVAEENGAEVSWYILTISTAVLAFPLTLIRSFTELRGLSIATVLTIMVTVVLIFVLLCKNGVSSSVITVTHNAEDVFQALSTQMLAYCCQFNILPLQVSDNPLAHSTNHPLRVADGNGAEQ